MLNVPLSKYLSSMVSNVFVLTRKETSLLCGELLQI